ncbi:ABC transporter ATP-binding protein [Candidatus Sumerlaeota bacterium]
MSKKTNSPLTLQARGLAKAYQDGERTLTVLKELDLKVGAGEIVSITGMSGSGKSTLLHLLGGLDRPTSGSVEFAGRELVSLPERELSRLRAEQIGIVFQFYHLLPEFSAAENVMIPRLILNESKRQARARAEQALAEVGLAERVDHRPTRMSGGEQQRVAIARALINDPILVLADEPTGNLDLETGQTIVDLLWSRAQERGCAMVMVTHEPVIAERADRHLTLADGCLRR